MINENFVWLGLAIMMAGTYSYLAATLVGRARPNRVTFLIWAAAPLIAFVAELNEGVGLRSVMTFSVGLGPLLILIASFVNKKSYWKVTRFDLVCGAFAAAALVLWQITGDGNVAIALALLADFLAALPTLVKSWRFPRTEVPWNYIGGAINSAIAMLVITQWSFASAAFPVYIFAICVVLAAVIVLRGRHAGDEQGEVAA